MKRTTNKIQREYMAAKELVETLEERVKKMEQAYILSHGIINPDGSTPTGIYCIEDDSTFNKASKEFAAEIATCGLEAERNAAKNTLKIAEEKLIEYGLSLVPSGIKAILEKGVKSDYAARQKLLDYILRLDVSTIPH